jgi:hypothetical protein
MSLALQTQTNALVAKALATMTCPCADAASQAQAARALRDLARVLDITQCLGIYDILAREICHPNVVRASDALSTLLQLSLPRNGKDNARAIANTPEMLDGLARVLHGGTPDARRLAAMILCYFSSDTVIEAAMVKCPMLLSGLVSVVRDGNPQGRCEAAWALANMAVDYLHEVSAVKGLGAALVSALRAKDSTENGLREAARCVWVVAHKRNIRDQIARDIPLLTGMLRCGAPDTVRMEVLRVMTRMSFGYKRLPQLLDSAELLAGIADVLRGSTDRLARVYAAAVLSNLSHAKDCVAAFTGTKGLLSSMEACLVGDDRIVHSHIVRALSHLSQRALHFPLLTGFVPALARVAAEESRSKHCREHAVHVLLQLSSEPKHERLLVATSEVLPALVRALREGSACAQHDVLAALANLSVSSENKSPIACVPGLLKALADVERGGGERARREASDVLAILFIGSPEDVTARIEAARTR